MTQLRRCVPIPLVALIAWAAACGDGSGPGPLATAVTGIAGDSQSGATGASLTFPLSLVALGSTGEPVQGVRVKWSVTPSGAASFTPATSTSDVNGTASTIAKLGSLVGDITIRAVVPGVSDVLYHATAIDPCKFIKPYAVAQTVTGTLSPGDCAPGIPYFYDLYDLTLTTAQSLRISLRWAGPPSTDSLDTFVELYRVSDGHRVGFDDDSILGQQTNSQLDMIIPPDRYFIGATSYGSFDTGPYTLSSELRPAALSGCRQVWMLVGASVADSLTANDCADSTASPRYYDVARMIIPGGTIVTLAQHSTDMNPAMTLYQLDCDTYSYARTLVKSNDDSSATNTDAFIVDTVPVTDCFDVVLSSSAPGTTGAYTFAVSASTTLSGQAAAPISAGRPWGVPRVPRRAKRGDR